MDRYTTTQWEPLRAARCEVTALTLPIPAARRLRAALTAAEVPYITLGHTAAGWVVYAYEHDTQAHERVPAEWEGEPVRVEVGGWTVAS